MRAYQWLQYFDEHTKPRLPRRTDYRLLIFDGHKSHKARDFINFCEQNRIIPLCFPSKLTHRLQPLDSHPFLAYKHYYRKHNNQAKKWGGSVTEKADFLRSIHKVRTQTFTESAEPSDTHSKTVGFGHLIQRLFAKNFVEILDQI